MPFASASAHVVAVDVAHAELRHFLVAVLHLAHRPLERDDRLLRIGDDRRQQMRDAVIDRQFEHLRIDHDQPALIRPQPIEQAEDHGVDRDRLARAGGAGDQQVRHAREIDDHGSPPMVLPRQSGSLAVVVVVAGGELLAQENLFALGVRQFDADRVAAGDDRDARRDRAHRAGDVVGEPDHARRLDAGRGLEFVERHHRAGPRVDDLAAHAEVFEHAFERGRVGLQRFLRSARRGRFAFGAARSWSGGSTIAAARLAAAASGAVFGLRGGAGDGLLLVLFLFLGIGLDFIVEPRRQGRRRLLRTAARVRAMNGGRRGTPRAVANRHLR